MRGRLAGLLRESPRRVGGRPRPAGTPERVTLYYTESAIRLSTTRTDEQLDAARDELVAWAARIRSGDFRATPAQRQCGWCDYRAICPSRVG
jgi:RecB family exonuclease